MHPINIYMERYSLVHYRIRLGVDPEPIWAEVQRAGFWLAFDAFGQVTFKIDSRSSFNSYFALRYIDMCDQITHEEYIG